IHKQEFPQAEFKSSAMASLTQKLTDFNSQVWDEKKKKNLSLKDEIKMKVPAELKMFEKDLVVMHNLV
ncbi:MAG TPA: hypothetical protein VJJ76_01285, partial [archaeon]|nr:hypothetical protein [archaeon]